MKNILSIIQTICLNYKLLEFYDLFTLVSDKNNFKVGFPY